MAFKMEGEDAHKRSEEVKDPRDKEVEAKRADAEVAKDLHLFARERNMLLLSALYKLYGEEWESSPDWARVAEEISNAKILGFGDHFTPDSCERQYKSLLEGYRLGFPDSSIRARAPRRLTEAQKRLWILTTTVTDIVNTSKLLDTKMRDLYLRELNTTESIPTTSTGEINEEEIIKLFGYSKEEWEQDDEDTDEEYENDETEEIAVEIAQNEVNEAIVGFKDVLQLNKYCLDAVEYSNSKFPALMELISEESSDGKDSPMKKADNTSAESIKSSSISNSQASEGTVTGGNTDIKEGQTTDSASKIIKSPSKTSDSQNKGTSEKSPQKQNSRVSNKDQTTADSECKETLASDETTRKGNGPQATTITVNIGTPSVRDSNGQDNSSNAVLKAKSPTKVELRTERDASEPSQNKTDKETNEKQATLDGETRIPDDLKSETSDNDIVILDDAEASKVQDSSSPTKDKSTKKSSAPTRLVTKRTPNRLISPEPSDQTSHEEDKNVKKTPSRQTSTSESNVPTLRSRRGATPTKASAPESESVRSTPSGTKTNATDEEEDENFATPRTTPESPAMKPDVDTSIETKPPLKTYSVKPPSPLTHVDPKLFEEFDDEDDPELTMIDSNVNQTKGDKSPAKPCAKRGRTGSSENASETIADDNTQSKRPTKKTGSNEDSEDVEGIGNNDENASKRLTRRSLKLHDAANDQNTETTQTGSEKAGSESSFNGKDRKSRNSKQVIRLKNLQEEKARVYGEGDDTPEGKRLTRARAKTSLPPQEKRGKAPSVGDSEGLSESEPTSTRATRSRSSTASSMPVLEPTSQIPPVPMDDEEQKTFRKNATAFVDKLCSTDAAAQLVKYIQDPHRILRRYVDFGVVKSKIEEGKIRVFNSVHNDLIIMATNAIMANPESSRVQEVVSSYSKTLKSLFDDLKTPRNSSQRNDNSDEESLESHDEQRSESSSKQVGPRRKRRRSASETSEEVLPQENKRRVTRTSTSSAYQQGGRKAKHPISPDIVSANRGRH